jgi:hypothetical protein
MSRATVTTDKTINLKQLDDELGGHGLCMNAETEADTIIMGADGSSVTAAALQAAVAAHVAEPEPEPTVGQKLAQLGLTIDELRVALSA